MIILDNLFPVFALIGLGALLKRLNFTSDRFLQSSDRIIYFIFFPVMLFWKIGSASPSDSDATDLIAAAFFAVAAVYIVGAVCKKLFKLSDFAAGSFSQTCYRFNTYAGMAVIMNAIGETGIARFGILIGFIIPFINVLAVSTLIWYGGQKIATRKRISLMLRSLISNPLIIGCLAGMAYSRLFDGFPVFLDNTLRMAAMVALPLALLSIGGTLSVKNFSVHMKGALLGSAIKLVVLPMVGWYFLKVFDASALSMRVGMLFFALPTSSAIVVLSSQLNSDTEFAATAIVISTILSFFSMSAVLLTF